MQLLIAVVIGAIVGAWLQEGFGALVGATLGWLLVRTMRQERAIADLRKAISEKPTARSATEEAREARVVPPPTPATAAAEDTRPLALEESAAVPVPPLAPVTPQPATTAMATPSASPGIAAAVQPVDVSDSAWDEPPLPPASPRADPLAGLQRWLFGGNTIVKVGVGILFIGLAFLAKFASEHVHVPIQVRLAAIGAVAIVLLVIGWRLRMKRAGYAQVLQGGAIAVMYLTLFVAFRFYGVLAPLPVFVLMVLVAALAAALAVLQDARALAVIGALGGFATPLLVSTGSGNHVALFSYYLVLDLGIAAVAWHRTWRSLNLIGFLATFVVGTAWGVLRYTDGNYASCQAFLIAYFLLFSAIMLMPVRPRRAMDAPASDWPPERWVHGSLLFGLPTITFVLQYGLVRDTAYGTAISALVLAAFYVLLARWMRSRPEFAVAFEGSLAVATVFLTLVIPFALDARSTAGAWALEGAGLVWLGLRQARAIARAFGYALLVLSGFTLLFAHQYHGTPKTVLNALFFNGLLVAAAAFAAAWSAQRAHQPRGPDAPPSKWAARGEAIAEPMLIGWGLVWLLVAAAVEIDAFVPHRLVIASWLATFSAIALLCALLAVRLRWPRIGLPAMVHAPLHAVGVSLFALVMLSPFDHGGAWAWPAAAAVHVIVLRWLAPGWPSVGRHAVHALGALVVAALGALQGRAFTADWGDASSAWPWLGWLVVPALMLMALPRAGITRRWPISADPQAYQGTVGGVLTVGLLLWTVLANLWSDGSARPLPHVPLLNPLDVGVGAALMGAWLWLRSEPARRLLQNNPAFMPSVLAAAGFVWLNAILIRGFHHYAGVPYHIDAWVHSLAVQTGITLLWTVISLGAMWAAARRGWRAPWLVGATLLGAVVLKLLLIDQSGTGTITRIVSFIGVGVLMLVIGYVAPLPSRQESGHAST